MGTILALLLIIATPLAQFSQSPVAFANEASPDLATVLQQAQPPTPDAAPPAFPAQELHALFQGVTGTFGVMVYDVTSDQVRYTQNEHESFYAASTIKLAIALTLYDMALRGTIDLTEQLVLKAEDIVPGTGHLQFEEPGTAYSLRELCARMIYDSDNTASNMLLTRIGFDQVNTLMAELGASDTRVETLFFSGIPYLAGRDIRSTPADLARISSIILWRAERAPSSTLDVLDAMFRTVDRSKMSALLPPEAVVMHKIGVIPGMEHDVGIVVTPAGRRYIVAFMSMGLSSNQAGIDAIARASKLIYDYEVALD